MTMVRHRKQRGFILFVVMLFLLAFTLIGAALFSSIIADQAVSGNIKEKARSNEAADTLIDYAQYWLMQPGNAYNGGKWITGLDENTGEDQCQSTPPAGKTPKICYQSIESSNGIERVTDLPWNNASEYIPAYMQIDPSGANSKYVSGIKYYIQFIPCPTSIICLGSNTAMYKITATSRGGNVAATSVIQSVVKLTATSRDIGN